MIGVSLPLGILKDKPATEAQTLLLSQYGGRDKLLEDLKKQGIASVELRSIGPKTLVRDVNECVQAVFDAGLTCTIHGKLANIGSEEFFSNLNTVVSRFPHVLEHLMLTVHSPKDSEDNETNRSSSVKLLSRFGAFALEKQMPVCFALENNRIHSNIPTISTCDGVLSIVEEVGLPNVGICWDFGHVYSNILNFPDAGPEPALPDPFLSRVVHTHIHAYQGRTHFPFMGEAELPLFDYCLMLVQAGYAGIFNLELDIERFYRLYSPREAFETSISVLKECLLALNQIE